MGEFFIHLVYVWFDLSYFKEEKPTQNPNGSGSFESKELLAIWLIFTAKYSTQMEKRGK